MVCQVEEPRDGIELGIASDRYSLICVLCCRPQTGRKEIRRSEFESKYSLISPEEAEVSP
jgi:hypothetical protein